MDSAAQIEVNLNILEKNVVNLFRKYNNYRYKIADLRNNAFGMGIFIVNKLESLGFDYCFVSTLREAINIRKYNQNIPILVEKEIDLEYIYDAINHNVTITIKTLDYLKKLINLEIRDTLKFHVLLDNKYNKLGIKNSKELLEIVELVKDNKKLVFEGIYTNLTDYGKVSESYYIQVDYFTKIVSKINDDLIIHVNEPVMYHKKNKLINGIKYDLSMFGIVEKDEVGFWNNIQKKNLEKRYGVYSFEELDVNLELAFSITAEVIAFKNILKGEAVGKNFVADENMDIAIIEVGHKDGITKAIKEIVINDGICEVIEDDLDYLYVKVSKKVDAGEKAYLISDYNYIDNVLENLKTNRYYLMSIINSDLKRVYIDSNEREEVIY